MSLARAGDETASAGGGFLMLRGDPLGALGSEPEPDVPNFALLGTECLGVAWGRTGNAASSMAGASGECSELVTRSFEFAGIAGAWALARDDAERVERAGLTALRVKRMPRRRTKLLVEQRKFFFDEIPCQPLVLHDR